MKKLKYLIVFSFILSAFVFSNTIHAGTSAIGANCVDQTSCINGAYCDVAQTPTPTCKTQVSTNDSCTQDYECVSNKCEGSACAAVKSNAGQSCVSQTDCNNGLYCDVANKGSNPLPVCATQKTKDVSCVFAYECVSNLCESKKCTAPRSGEEALEATTGEKIVAKPPFLNVLGKVCSLKDIEYKAGESIGIPWIGQCVNGLFRYAIFFGSLLTILFIIIGGVMYTAGGVAPSVAQKAKERISKPLLGMIFLLLSYTLLSMINPDIVNLNTTEIKTLVPTELDLGRFGADSSGSLIPEGTAQASCATESDLISIGGGKKLHKDAAAALEKAKLIAQQNGRELEIISALRSLEKQQQLWAEALKVTGGDESVARKTVSKPSCSSPHLTGRAADICLKGSQSCGKIKGKYANYSDTDVALLQKIMQQAGWVRYCGEWWHFEHGLAGMSSRCSP